jgi:hypothetical protein
VLLPRQDRRRRRLASITIPGASVHRSSPAWRTSVAEASVVIALDSRWSVQFGLFTSVWAVKINTQHGVTLSVWRTF